MPSTVEGHIEWATQNSSAGAHTPEGKVESHAHLTPTSQAWTL